MDSYFENICLWNKRNANSGRLLKTTWSLRINCTLNGSVLELLFSQKGTPRVLKEHWEWQADKGDEEMGGFVFTWHGRKSSEYFYWDENFQSTMFQGCYAQSPNSCSLFLCSRGDGWWTKSWKGVVSEVHFCVCRRIVINLSSHGSHNIPVNFMQFGGWERKGTTNLENDLHAALPSHGLPFSANGNYFLQFSDQ